MGLFKPRRRVEGSIAAAIDDHMRCIRSLFPGDAKLTLVIRSERFATPVIFTNDNPDATIAAIREMTTASPNLVRAGE